ncbi:MAG: geranylgeranylglycerol-phosphate geranylgeranyltransferase [Saprospiraceae bacterium]
MRYYLKLIRWPNLVMTVLALWVHWYYLIYLSLDAHQTTGRMDHFGILLLGLAFSLVMGAGYVINDIFDLDIDAINKEKSQILINHISMQSAKIFYWILNSAAAIISLYIAIVYDQSKYLFLLPVAAGLLYFYSSSLKKKGLIGNIVIAVLCGAVLLLPLWFDEKQLQHINFEFYSSIRIRFIICFTVAALLTLIREIIKDQEDESGDRAGHASTLPIIWGSRNTDVFVTSMMGICLMVIIFSFQFVNTKSFISLCLLFSVGTAIFSLLVLQVFKVNQSSYTQRSRYLKFVMVLGMICLPIALKII